MADSGKSPLIAHQLASISSLIVEAARLVRQDFGVRALHLKLTQSQAKTLVHLHRDPGITQTQLAERLEIRPATVTPLLDRLVTAGWVRRQARPLDRRAQSIYLTESAEPMLAEIARLAEQTSESAFSGMTKAERGQLTTLLNRVKSNLSSNSGSSAESGS